MWLPFILAQPALAPFDVHAVNCALDTTELSRLTALELSSAGAPPLRVDYTCEQKDVTIGLENPETGIRIERKAEDVCCANVETERTFALLATGLFKAAGGALGETPKAVAAAPEPEPVPPPPHAPPPPPPPMPAPVITPSVITPPVPSRPPPVDAPDLPPPDFIHSLGVSGRVRAWNLEDPIMGYGVGLEYRAWVWPRIGFGAYASALFGSSDRLGGEVMARTLSAGGVAAWRFVQYHPVTLSLELHGGLSIVTIAGRAATDEFAADSLDGATGELGLNVVPAVSVDRTRLELPFGVGALFRAPRGTISAANTTAEIRIDGVSFGGALRVSLGFIERRVPPTEAKR